MNFKEWVEQHNPEEDWNWDSPQEIQEQLIETIRGSGTLDLKTLFDLFFLNDDPGLTVEQNQRFIEQTDYSQ